jgi:mTERF domain-containing protein
MMSITDRSPSILSFTASNVKGKLDNLSTLLDIDITQMRRIIQSQPQLLHLSQETISLNIDLLLICFSKEALSEMVIKYPSILGYSRQNIVAKVKNIVERLFLSKNDFERMCRSTPEVLAISCSPTGALEKKLNFFMGDLAIPPETFGRIAVKCPLILCFSLEDNLQPAIIGFYVGKLKFSDSEITKLLLKYPQILNYNADNTVWPIYVYLSEVIGLKDSEIKRVLLKYPKIVTHSLAKMQSVVGFLSYECGYDEIVIRNIFRKLPQIVSLSVNEGLRAKIKYLAEDCGWGEDVTLEIFRRYPSALSLSSAKIDRIIAVLEEHFGSAAVYLVPLMAFPTILGYSTERLSSRLEGLRAAGLSGSEITYMITKTEESWQSWVDRASAKGLSSFSSK